MNKHDKLLIVNLGIIILALFLIFYVGNNKETHNAYVYYNDDLVLTIDLDKEETEYTVEGFNGPVKIIAGNGKVKIEEEDSPRHLCSKQGYISKSYESIVCLPNKIYITFDGKDSTYDTVVK